MQQDRPKTYEVDIYAEGLRHPAFWNDVLKQQEALQSIYGNSGDNREATATAQEEIVSELNKLIGFDPRQHVRVGAIAFGEQFILPPGETAAHPLKAGVVQGLFAGASILNSSENGRGIVQPEIAIAINDENDPRLRYMIPFDLLALAGLVLRLPIHDGYGLVHDKAAFLRREGGRIHSILNDPSFSKVNEQERRQTIRFLLNGLDSVVQPGGRGKFTIQTSRYYEVISENGRKDQRYHASGGQIHLEGVDVETSLPEYDRDSSLQHRRDLDISGGMPELKFHHDQENAYYRIPLDACIFFESTPMSQKNTCGQTAVSAERIKEVSVLDTVKKAKTQCASIVRSKDFRRSPPHVQRLAFNGILEKLNTALDSLCDSENYPATAVACMANKFRKISVDRIGTVSYSKLPEVDQSKLPTQERKLITGDAVFAAIPELEYQNNNQFKNERSFRFSGGEPVIIIHVPEEGALYLMHSRDITVIERKEKSEQQSK